MAKVFEALMKEPFLFFIKTFSSGLNPGGD